MKKLSKILAIVMIVTMLCMTVATISMAATAAPDPKQYTGTDTDVEGITNIGNQVITIVSTVGSIASVIVLVILGLKYMMGSAEEKAEYKKTLMPYIIGAALVFAASAISGIIFSFTQGLGG